MQNCSTDIIIVLGHEMDDNGIPDTQTKRRLDKAYQLYSEQVGTLIMVMGWAYKPDRTPLALADSMANYLENEYQMPSDGIYRNIASRDTVGDAWFSKQIYLEKYQKNNQIAFVTSDYHLPRAQEIFNFIYGTGYNIQAYGVHTAHTDARTQKEQESLAQFHRTFKHVEQGDDDAISATLYQSHPLYRDNQR